jgi:hypothetical protein
VDRAQKGEGRLGGAFPPPGRAQHPVLVGDQPGVDEHAVAAGHPAPDHRRIRLAGEGRQDIVKPTGGDVDLGRQEHQDLPRRVPRRLVAARESAAGDVDEAEIAYDQRQERGLPLAGAFDRHDLGANVRARRLQRGDTAIQPLERRGSVDADRRLGRTRRGERDRRVAAGHVRDRAAQARRGARLAAGGDVLGELLEEAADHPEQRAGRIIRARFGPRVQLFEPRAQQPHLPLQILDPLVRRGHLAEPERDRVAQHPPAAHIADRNRHQALRPHDRPGKRVGECVRAVSDARLQQIRPEACGPRRADGLVVHQDRQLDALVRRGGIPAPAGHPAVAGHPVEGALEGRPGRRRLRCKRGRRPDDRGILADLASRRGIAQHHGAGDARRAGGLGDCAPERMAAVTDARVQQVLADLVGADEDGGRAVQLDADQAARLRLVRRPAPAGDGPVRRHAVEIAAQLDIRRGERVVRVVEGQVGHASTAAARARMRAATKPARSSSANRWPATPAASAAAMSVGWSPTSRQRAGSTSQTRSRSRIIPGAGFRQSLSRR